MLRFIFLSLAIASTFLNAEDSASNVELSKKLDLVLKKMGALEYRVRQLESDNKKVKKSVDQTLKATKQSITSQLSSPSEKIGDDSFFKKLSNKLKSEEIKSSGPWTKSDNWSGIRKNLTRYQIRLVLGNPHEIKINLDPRIDQVYSYSGDLDADGVDEVGLVNFYRDRVVSFISPF